MARRPKRSRRVPKGFERQYSLTIEEHSEPRQPALVTGIEWHPDGDTLACLSEHQLQLADHSSGSLTIAYTFEDSLMCSATSPDGDTTALGTREHILLLDYHSGNVIKRLATDRSELVWYVAWSPDGRTLAAVTHVVRLWDVQSGRVNRTFRVRRDKCSCVAWSPDGEYIAWATDHVYVCRARTGEVAHQLALEGLERADKQVGWSPDGHQLAIGCSTPRRVLLWDEHTNEVTTVDAEDSDDPGSRVCFSPDGRLLASSYLDQLKIWSVADRRLFAAIDAEHTFVHQPFAFHPTAPMLAIPATGNLVEVWSYDDSAVPGTRYVAPGDRPEESSAPPVASRVSTPKGTHPDIFLSYAREDLAQAERLARALEGQGWSVWWDIESLRGGDAFHATIQEALDTASCVIVLWSPHSITSSFVLDEAGEALRARKLLPVRIAGSVPPLGFRGVHTLSLAQWAESAENAELDRLVADLRRRLPSAERATPEDRSTG